MDIASFVTSLLTSFVIFVVLVLVFAWLSRRPGNAPVYYPSVLLRGLDPWEGRGKGTRSPVGWVRQAFSAPEADVIAAGGVDAAVYLVFLSSGTCLRRKANRSLRFSSFVRRALLVRFQVGSCSYADLLCVYAVLFIFCPDEFQKKMKKKNKIMWFVVLLWSKINNFL